jgi:hypothetical protein
LELFSGKQDGGDGEHCPRVEKGILDASTFYSSVLVFSEIENEQKASEKRVF